MEKHLRSRRLAVLCSHLRPISPPPPPPPPPLPLPNTISTSICVSSDDQHRGNRVSDDCVFCRIIRGQSPSFKLYEDDICLCILDMNPLSNGHSLVISKSHYSSLLTTPPSVVAAMCSKVPVIANAIVKATVSDSFNLLVNNGAAAGQVIFHTHMHIIPRKAYDCLWTTESLRRLTLNFDEKACQLVDIVRAELSNTSGSGEAKGEETSVSRS